MKKLFISMLAVAAMVSCSKEQTVSFDKGEEIGFNSFVENSTRAADPSYSTSGKGVALEAFKVYGTVNNVNIYNDVTIEKQGAAYGAAWKQVDGQQQYWIAGANYIFDAVVDATTVTTDLNTGLPTQLYYEASTQTDMLYDRFTTTGKPSGTGLVAFAFEHLLSKINFTVTNQDQDANGYSFVVRDIKFAGNVTGVYNVDSGWDSSKFTTDNTIVGNERTVTIDGVDTRVKDIVVATGAASAELATEVLFIPGTYGITFIVDILYNGVTITSTQYPAEDSYTQELVANNAYNFNVTVSVGDPIKFTATQMPEWDYDINDNDDDTDDDIDLE